MKRKSLIMIGLVLVIGAYAVVMPGCGSRNDNNTNYNPYYNCQPGQVCVPNGGYNTAQGIPLINTPTISYLDPSGASNLILTYGAPNVVAGQPYMGPVNISGVLRLAPNACPGIYQQVEFQVSGQGQWESGFAGSIARVQGSLQVTGGTNGIPAGAVVSFQPALVRSSNVAGYSYTLSYGPGLYVSLCNYLFAFYNF